MKRLLLASTLLAAGAFALPAAAQDCNVTVGLVARGWTEAEIGKVLGGNWLRVYEQVWGA